MHSMLLYSKEYFSSYSDNFPTPGTICAHSHSLVAGIRERAVCPGEIRNGFGRTLFQVSTFLRVNETGPILELFFLFEIEISSHIPKILS